MPIKSPTPDPTPPPLNEEQLLDWVEGRLSPADEAFLARSSGRVGLVERIGQMQANRRSLQDLGAERAPPELMERVLAALERGTLLDAPAVEAPPTLHLPARRPRPRRRWDAMLPGLAMAAGVALLVAGGAYWGNLLLTPSTVSPSGGPLAAATPTPRGTAPVAIDENTRIASADRTEASGPTADGAASPLTSTLALAEPTPRGPIIVDAARAIELAREGRVVMRVLAKDIGGLAQIEQSAASRTPRAWRLTRDVPATVMAAVMPAALTLQAGAPMLAAAHTLQAALPLVGPGAAITWPRAVAMDPIARVRGTYLVNLPDSDAALATVRAVFADRCRAGIVFEELAAPVATPAQVDPDSLLWWTQPASAWARRITIPIVVEQR